MGLLVLWLADRFPILSFLIRCTFYTSAKLFRDYTFTAVCLCVCVCPALRVSKIPAEQVHRFGRGFRWMFAYHTGLDPIEISDLGSKVKVTVLLLFLFYLQIFRSIFVQYGHIWYQNDGNEMFYQTIRFIIKNIYNWIFSEFFSSFLDTFSVTVTLTFRPKSPISIGSESVQ